MSEQVNEIAALIEAVDRFGNAMKLKLIEKFLKDGFTSWNERENFAGILEDMQRHAERGPFQTVDVANLCMFLWNMIDQFNMGTHEVQELLDESGYNSQEIDLEAQRRLDAGATDVP